MIIQVNGDGYLIFAKVNADAIAQINGYSGEWELGTFDIPEYTEIPVKFLKHITDFIDKLEAGTLEDREEYVYED